MSYVYLTSYDYLLSYSYPNISKYNINCSPLPTFFKYISSFTTYPN